MTGLPLYYRVYLTLRDRIANGEYDWRTPLPGEQQLAAELNISRATLRRAFELLRDEGLVERRQGKRTYVKRLGYSARRQRRNLEIGRGATGYRSLFAGEVQQSFRIVATDAELQRQFGLRRIGRVARVRVSRGKPYCYVVTYLPVAVANKISWAALGNKPVITAVEEAGFEFSTVEQVITAVTADGEAALMLNVPLGSALLRVSGLFVDADARPVMRKDGYFLPESFEYRTTITKPR